MTFNLVRHEPTQMYYWKESTYDRLVDAEFISFQGDVDGFELKDGKTYVTTMPGACFVYRRQGTYRPLEIITRESHLIEILGDDVITIGINVVINTLNPNPIEVSKIFKEPEL